MLTDQSIIYFAPEPWDGLWRNRQQLMSIFARHNKVLFVEERLYFKRLVTRWRQGELRLRDLPSPSLRRLSDNLAVLRYPGWAPVSGSFPVKPITRWVRRVYLEDAMRRLQMTDPILWFSRPAMVDLIHESPPAQVRIYHVVDEYAAYVGQSDHSRRRAVALESAMLAEVDLVVAVSEKLQQTKKTQHANTHLVPNGVDYELYERALQRSELPAALAQIPGPRLGYIGLIGDKLDFDLLWAVASHNPAWSLVFLGETKVVQQAATWQALCQLPNVYHLGAVPAECVPDYVKGFNVGLMPYMCDHHAEHISPLKLYDYLAAGLPVVSVNIPAARLFAKSIHVAATPAQFLAAIGIAVAEQTPAQRQARRAVAAQHTWEQRVEQISELIQNQLRQRALAPKALESGRQIVGRWTV